MAKADEVSSPAVVETPRASMVVMDAESGSILAVAQYPTVPEKLNGFDFAALAAGNPAKNPMRPAAWTPETVPGSSFKLAVDLTALRVSADNPDVQKMIAG